MMVKQETISARQGDGVPKARQKPAAADPRGSRTCLCAQTHFHFGVAHAEGEGRINVLPWYRQVGVAKYLQLDALTWGEEPGCPKG